MTIRPVLIAFALAVPTASVAQRAPPPADVYQEAVPFPEVAETTNNKALDRRLDRSEKALRELRSIVLKAQAQGAPVEVKPVGPDPALLELQQRFGDLEATVRDLTGQNERLLFELDQAKKASADAQGQVRALGDRLDKLQQQLIPPDTMTQPAGPPGSPGALGPPPAPSAQDETGAYQQARQILDSGDFAGGAAAMEAFVQQFPNSPRVGTAQYWAGRAYAARNQHDQAAAAFAKSLKGWPKDAWAGDSVAQLAGSLVALKRPADACGALAEFNTRYAAKANPTTKAVAARARANANCN
jgi:tol-pal system protein YbgF